MVTAKLTSALFLTAGIVGCADHPVDDDEPINCAVETRADTFVAGLEKSAQSLTFRLMSATPAPPARGNNTWSLELEAGGAPVDGAALRVTPYMPDHSHGSSIEVNVTPSTGGMHELEPVNLWMPALWETTIEATANGQTESVVFRFCIPS